MSTAGQPGLRLPQDEAAHQDPVEWWYFNGHLRGVDAAGHPHCYGFEYVTFQLLGFTPVPTYLGNVAITDLTRGSFHYGSAIASYPVPTTKNRFSLHTGSWSMTGGSGRDVLHAGLPGYALDLDLQATEAPVLEGADGVVSLGPLGTSKYYSWTSLVTSGKIVDHAVPVKVDGISWMDHQWGTIDLTGGSGWDWFSVQLSNGQQYMIYFIRNESGNIVHSFATRVSSAGRATYLDGNISERSTGSWHSSASGITYGSGWAVTLPGGQLDITPDLRNQELDLQLAQNVYWEGDVSVQGRIEGRRVAGVGYTELNPPQGH
jgi:predicted secreted hydrolase